jgi:membrane complex biogenesis BtpA family protein
MTATDVFGPKAVVGMVHLLPLPGSAGWGGSMDGVLSRATLDARTLVDGGLHGVVVENYGDVPYFPGPVPAETVASMAAVVTALRGELDVPLGVNVLRNDGPAALAVAAAAGAAFIRVNVHTGSMFTDQGLIQGRAHETLRLRATLRASVAVFADVFVKHADPPAGTRLEDAARDARQRGLADALIVSGDSTGRPTDPAVVTRVKEAVPDVPVWVGSGATPETARLHLRTADGLIVGSALQRDGVAGRPVDAERVRRFMDAVSAG